MRFSAACSLTARYKVMDVGPRTTAQNLGDGGKGSATIGTMLTAASEATTWQVGSLAGKLLNGSTKSRGGWLVPVVFSAFVQGVEEGEGVSRQGG